MDNTLERQPRAPPQGGSWLIPLGFFVLLGLVASGIRWFAVGWVFILSFVSTYAFMFAIAYRRKRFGRRGGTVHPSFEEEEKKGDKFLCGIILALTIFLPESIVYVLCAAAFIVLTSRIFIR